jgi:hypothetical protein
MIKTDIEKFVKLETILSEMYDINSKWCVDCFFNMYYQFKRKIIVEEKCNYDNDTISNMWEAINRYEYLTNKENVQKGKAFMIALHTYKVDRQILNSILRSFEATLGTKSTKFKGLS